MKRINLLRIKSRDKLVILSDQILSDEDHVCMMREAKKWAGDVPIIVLGKGFMLAKVSKRDKRRRGKTNEKVRD